MDKEWLFGWEVVPYSRDLRLPWMVGMGFGFSKRIHTEGAGLSKAGELGTRRVGPAYFPAKVRGEIAITEALCYIIGSWRLKSHFHLDGGSEDEVHS